MTSVGVRQSLHNSSNFLLYFFFFFPRFPCEGSVSSDEPRDTQKSWVEEEEEAETNFWMVSSGHRSPDGDFDGLVFGDVAEPLAAGRRVFASAVQQPLDLCRYFKKNKNNHFLKKWTQSRQIISVEGKPTNRKSEYGKVQTCVTHRMFPLTFFLLAIVMRNLYSLSACAPNHGGYAKGRVCAQLKGNPTERNGADDAWRRPGHNNNVWVSCCV